MIKLIGVLIVIIGFALKLNAIGIVMTAGIATGLVSGMSVNEIFETLGATFIANRYMALFLITLPVVGMLERNGLKQIAAKTIHKIKKATPGKVIMSYGIARTLLAAFNVSFGGVAGFVRPVVYPMAQGALEVDGQKIKEDDEEEIKAICGAIENIAWFFGQVLFVAGAGILLVKGTLEASGFAVEPIKCVQAELPVAAAALVFAWIFFMKADKKIMKKYKK